MEQIFFETFKPFPPHPHFRVMISIKYQRLKTAAKEVVRRDEKILP